MCVDIGSSLSRSLSLLLFLQIIHQNSSHVSHLPEITHLSSLILTHWPLTHPSSNPLTHISLISHQPLNSPLLEWPFSHDPPNVTCQCRLWVSRSGPRRNYHWQLVESTRYCVWYWVLVLYLPLPGGVVTREFFRLQSRWVPFTVSTIYGEYHSRWVSFIVSTTKGE